MYNYNLLVAIMEKVTGKRFPKILKEFVTDTLHLENTRVDNILVTIPGRIDYFDRDAILQVVNATFRDMCYCAPSIGILSNAGDLVKFGNAILNSEYISEKIRKKLFTPVLLFDGYPAPLANGWITIKDNEGRKFYGRTGSVTGGGAALLLLPEEGLVVAGAVNLTADTKEMPVFNVVNLFISKRNEKERKAETEAEARQRGLAAPLINQVTKKVIQQIRVV
ncbi:MAG: beta-lactamase family protein [Prolixibacteraceae bacterium]|nr:beta-lactamase family protein [Prolixibacteraceae bacterium]